ncbi:MAG: hypothetical protein WC869_00915 [Phycisphaerae bacterium]|jgi:hypothetical protein
MSPALDLLAARKQAALFGLGDTLAGLTPFGRAEKMRAQGTPNPTPVLRNVAGVQLPPRMAPQAFPEHVQAAKAKSLANTQQIQDIMARVRGPSAALAPAAPSPADLQARHETTMNALKAVEASRARPKLPLPAGVAMKAACFDCPATEVLRLRAA